MKSKIKRKTLALVLAISMILMSLPISGIAVAGENNTAPFTNPFSQEVQFVVNGKTESSRSYRIPSMVTLADGTIVAAADIRWNTTYDGGGLDTLVARSTDGGATWTYKVANYLGDNGNVYNGGMSTTFIDPNLLVAADGRTVYMLVDLYAYGVALNGDGSSHIQPVADTGFDANGNLKLSNNDHSSYDYYLKDGEIYNSSNQVEDGYTVDPYFNITYTLAGETKQSNLFFADSPFKVARTQYLYLTKSTDGGATWSEPNLLDVRAKAKVAATENALLVSPGNSITTSDGFMVYPTYSFIDSDHQALALIYSTDGVNWMRSSDYTALNWSSEGSIVELQNGNLRVFVRNRTGYLCYVDFDMNKMSWIGHTQTTVPTNSNTQLSAITYSKTFNGQQVILVSCPTGPNEAGSNNNDGSCRTNGKIFMGVVAADGTMSWPKSIDVGPAKATSQLSGFPYTEDQGFFAYSCLTERSDGSIAILYENNQFDWGAGDDKYFTINAKAYSSDNLGLPFDDEKVIDRTATIRDGVTSVTLYADPSDSSGAAIDVNTDILPEIMAISGMYYDDASGILFYRVRAAVGFSWPEAYDAYAYIPADAVDLRTDYGIAIPIVDFTNAAPLVRSASIPQPATYKLRSSARTLSLSKAASNTPSGLVLDKTVTDNGNGTYTVNLEAYTTGTVTVQQTTKPMDIVLVLDQSGSMADCIGCGGSIDDNSYHEVDTEDVVSSGTYYIRSRSGWSGWSYLSVYYCATCNAWHESTTHNPNGTYRPDNRQFYEACTSRLDALKNAVNTFIEKVHTAAKGTDGKYDTEDDVRHRIAIVGFANYSNYKEYSNTEVFIGANQYTYGTNARDQYKNALQFMNTQSGYNNVVASKNALSASGATYVDLGIEMANGIFGANDIPLSDSEERGRVMIVFTDGVPGYSGGFGDGDYGSTANNATAVADKAIKNAYTTKNTYNATVYTVGVFEGANASNPTTLPGTNNITQNSKDVNANRYMHLTSSNYIEARSMTETGTINDKVSSSQSYYMSAGSTNALDSIFEAMSESIEGKADVELGADTIVKDIVTPQFTLPKNTSDVTVQQFNCLSYNAETGAFEWRNTGVDLETEDTVTFDTDKNTVSITGFDFTHNYVASVGRDEFDSHAQGEFRGRKLVITFTIKPDPDFLGGDNVKTNDEKSGVYAPGEESAAGTFTPGYVDVPLKEISNAAQDKHIYLGNTTNLIGILNLHVAESQSGKDLQSIANGINNAYVNLVYTVTVNGGTVYTYTIEAGEKWDQGEWKQGDTVVDLSAVSVTENTDYSVTCIMTSVNNNSNKKSTVAPATIFVYKPTVTFKDSVQEYNKALNMGTDVNSFLNAHKVVIVWKNGETLSTPVKMEGNEPEITFVYTYADGAFNGFVMKSVNDVPVNVTATIKGTGTAIGNNEGVTYEHQDCGSDVKCNYQMGDGEFIVHVINALTSLTIKKTGAADIDVNQSFLFTVTGKDADGKDINLTVTVHGNGSTIIDGLVIGNEYTITEKTDWSWRYEFSKWEHRVNADDATTTTGSTNGAAIKLGENGTITFTNKRKEVKWLDGDSWCNNIFNRIIKMFK